MDAREAIRESFDATVAKLDRHNPDQINPLKTPEMRRVLAQLLMVVSSDEPQLRTRSWAEVNESVDICVNLVPDLVPIAEHAKKMFRDIVRDAIALAPTYVSPPAYV